MHRNEQNECLVPKTLHPKERQSIEIAALDLDQDLDLASKRAVVQTPQIATSGGRAQGLRREVT
ncbi:MAG: hypothetical protein OXF59_06850, partial [Pseudomonas sp.]|nr:hypothetical protein [Pseudomonas sp.]